MGIGDRRWASYAPARKGTWGEGFNAVGASGGEPALGQWYDTESGLHYNFFRYYDPDVGRFLSPDPIDLLGGLNAYLAVSDPLVQYDRFGLEEDCGPNGPKEPPPASPPRKAAKRGPKTDPNAPHNKKIREIGAKLQAEGNVIVAGGGIMPERAIPTPSGQKGSRRPDIAFTTPSGDIAAINVGRTRADGSPVTREQNAIADLTSAGVPTTFAAYDR